ncbi:hypothetical protein [Sphingomonas sp. NFR15]|uniref:hypothetical protein n=1 Tax=Sphingomonas sp. NFR15 TaxID=1566282 RepID=UPI00088AF6A7|nr:hypothetical protein [Sphingomonas sp. NFR15]SDA22094.1 hypothetical protein SAMN03159340_01539 [Sphingomonas sp. NFR15]
MPFLLSLAAAAHTGVPVERTAPAASDIALFVMAAIGVFLVRRALRKRFLKSRQKPPVDRDGRA